jgi:energy-converting hydrogenase Eha subunit A
VVLVLLVLLIGLHPAADEFVEGATLIYAVIALAGLIVVPLVRGRPSLLPNDPARKRSRPRAAFQSAALSLLDDQQPSFPLRR